MEISNIRQFTGEQMGDELADEPSLRTRLGELQTRAAQSEGAAAARQQLAERTLDMTEEYFPEETAARRRQAAIKGLVAGIVLTGVAIALLRR